jgi:hypothetical protein
MASMRSSCSTASLFHFAARSASGGCSPRSARGCGGTTPWRCSPRGRSSPRWTRRRSGRVDLHRRAGHAQGGSARSRGRAQRPRVVAGAARRRRRRCGRFREGAALVGAHLPPVELRRRPESVVRPPLRPRRRATSERRFFAFCSSSLPRLRDGPPRTI